MKTSVSERTHIIVGYSKQLEGSILPSPTFLNPANKPAPSPIVPKEPSAEVTSFITLNNPLKLLSMVIIASEFATFSTVSVQVFSNLLRLPSQDFAVLSRNIQYHSQHDISC